MLLCWLTGRSTPLSMKDLSSLDDGARCLRRSRVVRSFRFRIQRKWIRLNEKESKKRWEPQARTFCLHNPGEWNDIVRSNVMVFLGSKARSVLSPSTKGRLFSSSLSPLIRFYLQPFNDCLVRLCRLCSVHNDEKVPFQTHSLPNGFLLGTRE